MVLPSRGDPAGPEQLVARHGDPVLKPGCQVLETRRTVSPPKRRYFFLVIVGRRANPAPAESAAECVPRSERHDESRALLGGFQQQLTALADGGLAREA
jgi:hypothetical protein